MGEAERDVTRLVLERELRDAPRDRVGSVRFEEREQRQECALAQHRQQERGDGEIGLVDERL